MTETTTQCPCCGGKVFKLNTGDKFFPYHNTYKPLPQPDLIKLREVLEEYDPDNDDPDMPVAWWEVYRNFYQAIKKLLEENKP